MASKLWVISQSADAAEVSGYIGRISKFDGASADFAMAYADQNRKNFRA
jgi:hypothetical protein